MFRKASWFRVTLFDEPAKPGPGVAAEISPVGEPDQADDWLKGVGSGVRTSLNRKLDISKGRIWPRRELVNDREWVVADVVISGDIASELAVALVSERDDNDNWYCEAGACSRERPMAAALKPVAALPPP